MWGMCWQHRQQLVAKIVDRVFVYDDRVIGIALHGDFGVVLDNAAMAPNNVLKGLNEEIKMGVHHFDLAHTHDGSDGIRTRDLCLDRAVC